MEAKYIQIEIYFGHRFSIILFADQFNAHIIKKHIESKELFEIPTHNNAILINPEFIQSAIFKVYDELPDHLPHHDEIKRVVDTGKNFLLYYGDGWASVTVIQT